MIFNARLKCLFFFLTIFLAQVVNAKNIDDFFGKSCKSGTRRKDCGDHLICYNNRCTNCILDDSQCSGTNIVCKSIHDTYFEYHISNQNITSICEHKKLFDPLKYHDIISAILVFLVSGFSSFVGIGGGGMYAVILQTILQFRIEVAARIANIITLGLSSVNLFVYLPKRHPTKQKLLIDYDAAMFIEPLILSGTVFGVLLNIMFPSWLISLLLVILLTLITIKVFKKYRNTNNHHDQDTDNETEIFGEANDQEIDDYILPKVSVLFGCWFLIVIFSLLKGSKNNDSIVDAELCSGLYWGLNIIQFITILILGSIGILYLRRKYLNNEKNHIEGEIKMSKKNIFLLGPGLILTGLITSIFGLGGGILKNPIMLELGIIPEVSVATSSFAILFTVSSTALQFWIFGLLPMDYSIAFLFVGFVGAFVGQIVVHVLLKDDDKPRFLILVLGILIIITTAAAFGYGLYQAISDFRDDVNIGFNKLC